MGMLRRSVTVPEKLRADGGVVLMLESAWEETKESRAVLSRFVVKEAVDSSVLPSAVASIDAPTWEVSRPSMSASEYSKKPTRSADGSTWFSLGTSSCVSGDPAAFAGWPSRGTALHLERNIEGVDSGAADSDEKDSRFLLTGPSKSERSPVDQSSDSASGLPVRKMHRLMLRISTKGVRQLLAGGGQCWDHFMTSRRRYLPATYRKGGAAANEQSNQTARHLKLGTRRPCRDE